MTNSVLKFVAMGLPGFSDVNNYRIRTRLISGQGRDVLIEFSGTEVGKYSTQAMQKLPYNEVGIITHVHYMEDSETEYSEGLHEKFPRYLEYKKANILNTVNAALGCKFESMEVVNYSDGVDLQSAALCVCPSFSNNTK